MKNFILLLLLASFFTACKSTSNSITSRRGEPKEKSNRSDKRNSERLAEQLIDFAAENIGVRYKYGGTTRSGFDCSGLMYTVFNSENIVLPRNSFEQSKIGVVLNQRREQAQKGDLIFFKTDNSKKINHVGIIIEVSDDEIKFIHSSTSKGVIISSTRQQYYKNSFVQINRIL